ncbi:MAG: Uma2 family endonuclease [Treponema sp.]|nr:Uma2 family endonuclease [Treponema sp.]
MELNGKVQAGAYTYRSYLSWGEDARCELIDGIPHMMAAPDAWHQFAVGEVHGQLREWLNGKPCLPFVAPFAARLFPPKEGDSDLTVVEPDILVICDRAKIADRRSCKGPPDFVVEVTSRSTRGRDFGEKKALYEKAGVREYWVVDRDAVYQYVPADGKYKETVYELDAALEIESAALPGFRATFRRIVEEAL